MMKLIGFVVFCLLIYSVFNCITWAFRGNKEESREDICAFGNYTNIDVVLVAGSNLVRYYQPMVAWKEKGYTSYNYATSAAKADLLKEYIAESRNHNEALLYVVDIRSFPLVIGDVDDSSLRNWSDSLPVFSLERWKGISEFLFSRNYSKVDVISYYFDISKYHTNYDILGVNSQWDYLNSEMISNIDKGFSPNLGHTPFEKPERVYDVGDLTDQQQRALDELLDYCDDNELNVLFICNPYIISHDDWLVINAVAETIVGRGYDFVNFNDYYDEIGLDPSVDFGDVNHVNYLGAEKYTEYLMNYLSEHYDLPDHRNEIEFSHWNDDYEEYIQSCELWKDQVMSLVKEHNELSYLGDTLNDIYDYFEWESVVRDNKNFTLIIRNNCIPSSPVSIDSPAYWFYRDYPFEPGHEKGIILSDGRNETYIVYDEPYYETTIWGSGGRADEYIRISMDEQTVTVGQIDYMASDSLIQIVVYDNTFQKVVDNINLVFDEENNRIEIYRP